MADNKNVQVTITALDETQRAFANLKASLKGLEADLGHVTTATTKVESANKQLSASNDSLAKSFTVFKAALPIASLSMVGASLLEAGKQAEKLRNGFEAATGGATAGANAMAFVRGEADRLGLDLQSTAGAFLKLSAASKGTALEGAKTQAIFTAVAGAGRSLGLSADEMNGALLAVSQMISKGTVQSEELRGQLGERLPGAFGIAARAMGVSTAELGKMLEQGKVVSDDFLPKFAVELQKTFPPGEKAMAGLTSETERLKTAWFDLKSAVMEAGGEKTFSGVIGSMTSLVNLSKDFVLDLKEGFTLLASGQFKKAFGDTPRILGGGKTQPVTGMDSAVLGLGSPITVDTSSTDWLFQNKTITKPVIEQSKIAAAGSFVVQNPNVIAPTPRVEEYSPANYNSFVDGFNSAQVQTEVDPYVRAWMDLDKKFSDLQHKYESLTAQEKSELSKQGINQSRIDTVKADAQARLAADELAKVDKQNQKEAQKEAEAWRKAKANDIRDRYEYEQKQIHATAAAKKKAADYAHEIGSIENNGKDPAEALKLDYTHESAMITARREELEALGKLDKQQIAEHQYLRDKQLAIDKKYAEDRQQLEVTKWEAVGGIVAGQLGQLAGMMDQQDRKQFETWKALASAQAVISSALAVAGILGASSYLGPFAIPLAISAGAIGLAQVAKIQSTQFQGARREFGGPVVAGQSYLVGEKRPEIFTPHQSGWITPRVGGSGQSVNTTQVFQISTGVADTVRAEIARFAPALAEMSVNAVKSAMRDGQFQRA